MFWRLQGIKFLRMANESEFILPYEAFSSFQKKAKEEMTIALIRGEDVCYPFKAPISDDFEETYFYLKKILLSLLWIVGGYRFLFSCDWYFFSSFKERIQKDEEVSASFEAIEAIYGESVSFAWVEKIPLKKEKKAKRSLSASGCRIGLDLGGSDIKTMAIQDGKVVYSSEIVWRPKEANNPSYHESRIHSALLEASSCLEHVDAVGISTSGVVDDELVIYPSLFASCSEKDKKEGARVLLKDLCASLFPEASFTLINDGDASALGASFLCKKDSVLGLSLGTSLAGGYVKEGFLYPYLNELSKVSVDFNPRGKKHYRLGIAGSSSEYLSQKGIVLLVEEQGVKLVGGLPEKLLAIQKLAEDGNEPVLRGYQELGKRLGSSVLYFSLFLDFSSVFLLGRVLSGKGGEILLETANDYLASKGSEVILFSSDERFKRLGQAYVAACLEK